MTQTARTASLADITAASPAHAPLLSVEGLSTHFSSTKGLFGRETDVVRAVNNVSFQLFEGETVGLVGESGCGKSTLGRSILRLIPPTHGRVTFMGRDLSQLPAAELRKLRREMQIVFQDPFSSLNPKQRIGDMLSEPLLVHKLASGDALQQRVLELLSAVGLPENAALRYPHEFSGGQRQRIGIARALALRPKLIVCDEAVSALDVSVRGQVLNLLLDLKQQFGLTYLFISHDLSVVRHICDRVLVMYLGEIVEAAPTEQLFSAPAHPYTRALISAVPVPDPTHIPQRVNLKGDVPSPRNPPSGCTFHPRCPEAMPRCASDVPRLVQVAPQRTSRCLLNQEIAEPRPGPSL